MFKNIIFAELKELLLKLGFKNVPTTGSHKIFQHPESEALIVLPSYENRAYVDTIHLVAVRRILIENELIDKSTFDSFATSLATTERHFSQRREPPHESGLGTRATQ